MEFSNEFLTQVKKIESLYLSMIIVDVKRVKPEMIQLSELIKINLNSKSYIVSRFSEMLDGLSERQDIRKIRSVLHTIDFCMRIFHWEEVLLKLKNVYDLIEDPSIKFEIEMLIRGVYERDWSGGDFEVDGNLESMWDLA